MLSLSVAFKKSAAFYLVTASYGYCSFACPSDFESTSSKFSLLAGEEVETFGPNDEDHVPKHVFVEETQQFLLAAARNVMVMGKKLAKQR